MVLGPRWGRLFLSQKEMEQRALCKGMLGVSHHEPSERANAVFCDGLFLLIDNEVWLVMKLITGDRTTVALRIECPLEPARLVYSKHPEDGARRGHSGTRGGEKMERGRERQTGLRGEAERERRLIVFKCFF